MHQICNSEAKIQPHLPLSAIFQRELNPTLGLKCHNAHRYRTRSKFKVCYQFSRIQCSWAVGTQIHSSGNHHLQCYSFRIHLTSSMTKRRTFLFWLPHFFSLWPTSFKRPLLTWLWGQHENELLPCYQATPPWQKLPTTVED